MNILSRFVAILVAACRAAARAAKRVGRPILDKTGKIVGTAYDWILDRSHDAIGLAEHAAQIPGAAVGAALGNRAPDASDIAAMAMAAGEQRTRPAPVAAASAAPAQPAYDPTLAVIAAAKDSFGLEAFHDISQPLASWIATLTGEERDLLAGATPYAVRGHLTGLALIPGLPIAWDQAKLDEWNEREVILRARLDQDPEFQRALESVEAKITAEDEPSPLPNVIRPARFARRRPEAAEVEAEPVAMRM